MVVILRGNDVVVEWRLAFSSEEFEYEAGRFYVYAGVKQTDAEYEIRDNVLYSTIPGNQLEAGLYSMVFAFTSYKGDELVLNKRKVSGAFVITEDEEEVVDGPVICDTSAYGRTLYSLLDVDSSSDNSSVNGAEEGNVLTFQNGLWRGVKVEADLTDVEGKIELITVTLEDHEARIEKVESSVGDTDKKIAANTQLITGLREYLNSLFAVVYKEDGTIDYVRTPHNFASDKTVSSLGVGGDGGAGSLGFSILQSWDDDSDASEVMALGSNLGRELYDSISVIKDENLKGISSRVDDIESELDSVSQTLTQHGTSIQNNRVSISEINERISPIEKVFNEIKTWFTLEGDVLRTTYSLASDQTVSSLGVGSDNGGSGVSYDRLDNWDNYVEGDGSVLSSDLGYGLLERIIDLEEGTSGDYASIEEKVDKNTNAITALSTSLNDFLTGVDVDDTINRWKELEKFLEGYKETATLADLLKGKVDTEAYNTAINGINETLGIHTTAINSNTANIASINTTLLNHDTRITNNANAITKIEKTLADWFTLEDGVLHSKYGLASDKTVSSLGIGSSEGGGASYNRLDAWSSYTADKAGYVLSALLGWDLNTRLGKIESGDIGDISLSNYYTKSEVFNRTEIDNMLLGYAKSEDIPAIPTALKNPYSLKFGSKSYDGSTEMTITAADLGALTEHQTIYNLTMQAGAFSVKTFDPNGSAQTVNIPTTTDHIAEGSNKYYSNTLVSNYLTGAVSSVLTSNLTASRALISNANGKIAVSAVTSTELGYLDGVTSAIQTQLNALSSRIKAYEDILKIENNGTLLHATVALASDSTLSSLGVGSDEDGGVGSVIDLTNVVTDILPTADDTYSIGGADLRWSDIWGVIGRFDTLLADDIRTTDGVSYVTQAWVENNFVKHATLDSYATLTYVSDAIEGLSLGTASQKDWAGAAATDPSRLVTEDWVLNKLQGYATTSVATTSANGLMSAAMVTKLNGIATGATAVTSSTVSGWGYTKNVGTVTGVKVNGTNYTPSNGIVDIGNVASYEAIADVVEDYLANDYALSSDTTDAVKLTTLSGRSQRITVSTLKTSLGLKALAYKDSIDLSAYAKTSQLENYYTKSEVHSYVAQEINTFNENLPVIPTKTSQLTNDSGFITSSAIPSLTGYAKLSSTNSFTAKQSFTAEIEVSKTDLVAPLTVQGTGNRAFVKFTSGSTNLGYLGFSAVNTPAWMPSDATEYLPLATQAWVEGKGYATTSDLNNLGDNIGAVVEVNFARKATTLAGYGITDGVLAGAIDLTNSDYTGLQDWADNSPSFVGSFYDKTVWYNVISLRHRNGTYDGNAYGMLLYSQLTVKGASLKYIQQMGGTWDEKARTILDSSNFSSYALPLSGGTISGGLSIGSTTSETLLRLSSKYADADGATRIAFYDANNKFQAYVMTGWGNLILSHRSFNQIGVGDAGIWCSTDNGTTKHTLIHSGNIGSYALTSSNYGTILNSIYAPKAITDSLINFKVGLSEGYINTFKCDTINGYSPVHSGNIGSQSVNYATSAGNATKLATARTIWGQSFDGSGNISGSLTVTGDILPSSTDTRSLGSTSSYWKNLYVGIITGHYQSGDVVKFSGSINANEGNISCKSLTVNGVSITGNGGGSFTGGTVANATIFGSKGSNYNDLYRVYVNGYAGFEGLVDAFGGVAGKGWEIMDTGDAYFTSVAQSSDERIKNILSDVRLSLATMANAPLVIFDWKNKVNKKHNVGTIAQYWQGVLPEVVSTTPNGTLSLGYGELGVAMGISLANILEDTNGRVATVEKEIKTLKEENKRLKERVAELEAA